MTLLPRECQSCARGPLRMALPNGTPFNHRQANSTSQFSVHSTALLPNHPIVACVFSSTLSIFGIILGACGNTSCGAGKPEADQLMTPWQQNFTKIHGACQGTQRTSQQSLEESTLSLALRTRTILPFSGGRQPMSHDVQQILALSEE